MLGKRYQMKKSPCARTPESSIHPYCYYRNFYIYTVSNSLNVEYVFCICLTTIAEDAAQVERATNLRHAETITHEVDGVYAIRAKGGDVIH